MVADTFVSGDVQKREERQNSDEHANRDAEDRGENFVHRAN